MAAAEQEQQGSVWAVHLGGMCGHAAVALALCLCKGVFPWCLAGVAQQQGSLGGQGGIEPPTMQVFLSNSHSYEEPALPPTSPHSAGQSFVSGRQIAPCATPFYTPLLYKPLKQ